MVTSSRLCNQQLNITQVGSERERSMTIRIVAWLIGVALMLAALASNAQAGVVPTRDVPRTKQADQVVIIKSERKLYLYRDGAVIRAYSIALGDNPVGDKHHSGDEKTPVGQYIINWRNPESRYHLSLHISYPDAQDRAYARHHGLDPGGNIMIHGQPDYDKRVRFGDWTNGCIAVSNEAIEEIWRLVPDGTPIHIFS